MQNIHKDKKSLNSPQKPFSIKKIVTFDDNKYNNSNNNSFNNNVIKTKII